uniref:DUF418 domain-containing protein n=1 Tax=Mesocestoides corti TaxID=53468 RepID=A0A5K3FY83_MESCO
LSLLQVSFTVTEVLLPYGWLAFLLSPGRLWYLGLSWVLFLLAGRVVAPRRPDDSGDSTSVG